MTSRARWRLRCLGWLLLAGTGCAPAPDTVYISRQAGPELQALAADAARILGTATGRPQRVRAKPLLPGWRGVAIGDPLWLQQQAAAATASGEPARRFSPGWPELVYAWLADAADVQWFVPGPLGEDIPHAATVQDFGAWLRSSPRALPGYVARRLSGIGDTPDERVWVGRNLLRERFAYNHALYQFVRPADFAAHPEWFAKDAAGRPIPPPDPRPSGFNLQPDLTQDGVVAAAAAAAIAHFDAHPDSPSFSIAANDTYTFGSFPSTYPWFDPQRWFRRYQDYSNHVFHFSNRVADLVAARHPDKYLGTLAYATWENVPDFPVRRTLMPYLTADRSQWYDRAFRAEDIELTRRWAAAGPDIIGTWDYIFGDGFLIPRSLLGVVGDSIPALHQAGLRAYFSQVGAHWAYDGHTSWLAARLLWDPEADPGALANMYFRRYYGPAAVPMRAFFDRAERIWMRQAPPARWLKFWRDPYQAFLYAPADLAAMRDHLAAARDLAAADPRCSARVQLTVDAFQLTEAFLHYMWTKADISRGGWADAADLERRLAELAAHAADMRHRQRSLPASSPLQRRFAQIDWAYAGDPASRARAEAADRTANATGWPAGRGTPGFASTDRWVLDALPSEHAVYAWERHAGGIGLRASDIRRGQVFSMFPAEPGATYRSRVRWRGNLTLPGEIHVRIDWYDRDMRRFASTPVDRIQPPLPAAVGLEARAEIGQVATAPAGAVYGRLFIRLFEFAPGESILIEDAGVWPGS
jgi:hypothetical protein